MPGPTANDVWAQYAQARLSQIAAPIHMGWACPRLFFGSSERELSSLASSSFSPQITGLPIMPPLFSIAYHQCRWNYKCVCGTPP